MHTLMNQVAEGLTVLDVTPSREEIERRVVEVSAGRFRRPVLVLAVRPGGSIVGMSPGFIGNWPRPSEGAAVSRSKSSAQAVV